MSGRCALGATVGDQQRGAARADDVHGVARGRRRARRARHPTACRDSATRALPSSFQPSTCTVCPRSNGAGAGSVRRMRQRCATTVPSTQSTPAVTELHLEGEAEPRGEPPRGQRDAHRQQVERAGEELARPRATRQAATRSSSPSCPSRGAQGVRPEHTADCIPAHGHPSTGNARCVAREAQFAL